MNPRAGHLYKQAQLLPQEDLAALAWALVDSLNGDLLADEDEITKSWVAESHRRSGELKRGVALALPLNDIQARPARSCGNRSRWPVAQRSTAMDRGSEPP